MATYSVGQARRARAARIRSNRPLRDRLANTGAFILLIILAIIWIIPLLWTIDTDYQQDKGTGICQPVPERPVRSYTRGSCPPGLSYAICCHQLFPLCWRCSMLNHTAEMTATSIKKMKDMADAKPTRNVEKPDS